MNDGGYQPLAAQLRPSSLDEYVGQQQVVGENSPLRQSLESGVLHSFILWGPPGTGKTTLARLCANYIEAEFEAISAVLSGVKDVREAIDRAKARKQAYGRETLLFVDEVHRFNKSQQDAFLPHIEDGTIIFGGATTENPSFELNNALLSRCRTYVLSSLTEADLVNVLHRAVEQKLDGIQAEAGALEQLAAYADGDARRALNMLELAVQLVGADNIIDETVLTQVLKGAPKRFDKGGDAFYDQISALHKAVRGSSPDGALYWLVRMLDGGCDPLYIARRMVRMASEDVGNADPRALTMALDAWQTAERLGSPEGDLALAQACVYIASAAKSNAVYKAFNEVVAEVRKTPSYEVPKHIRNAPTELMKTEGYGEGYRYSHDEPHAFSAGENYLPEPLKDAEYYRPVTRGLETKIKDKLDWLKSLDKAASYQRYRNK